MSATNSVAINDELHSKPMPNLLEAFELLSSLPDDFMQEGHEDALPQERDCEQLPDLKLENWVN
jgi:hypothetical protein